MSTTVANLRDGWVEGGVYIGRAGRGLDGYFGNPFNTGERATKIRDYEIWFLRRLLTDPVFFRRIESLRDKTLMCFCTPLACHGDVIARWLNMSRGWIDASQS